MSNHHTVSSDAHLQSLLSQDLNRVSLINFWAPWAEPSKHMNQIVEELVKKFPTVQFLQVEAEELSEISESYEIEVVPSFIILRGVAVLSRVSGADAVALRAEMNKFAVASPRVQARTDGEPRKAPKGQTPEELEVRLRRLMNQAKVVLFMKGSPDTPRCGFSRKICALLREQNVEFTHFDILTDDDVRQGLKSLNKWPTFPQLIINGELVGGLDILQDIVDSGGLAELLVAET